MVMVAIFIALLVPSSDIVINDEGYYLSYYPKDFTVSDIVRSPLDSLIGKNDGQTIKVTNEGTANGVLSLVLLIFSIGSFVAVCSYVGVFEQVINLIINSRLKLEFITGLLVVFFVLNAATWGLYESAFVYVPILQSLYQRFKIKSIFPVKLLVLSLSVGYIASPINPFATMIADQSASVEANLFAPRLLLLTCLSIALIVYLVQDIKQQRGRLTFIQATNSVSQLNGFNLLFFCIPYIYMTIGLIWFSQFVTLISIALMFLIISVLICLSNQLGLETGISQLCNGASKVTMVAMSIILSRVVYIVLFNSHVIDTIIYHLVLLLEPLSHPVIIIFVFLIILLCGFFIPSPSALAFMTLPILAPALALLGISPSITVTVFLLAHGLTKMFAVTSPLVIAAVGVQRISYLSYVYSVRFFLGITLIITWLVTFGVSSVM